MNTVSLAVRIERETLSDGQPIYVALCLELDLACQGTTVEEAKENLTDAVQSFFELATPSEIERRLPLVSPNNVFLTQIEVPFGQAVSPIGG